MSPSPKIALHTDDCIGRLRKLPDASVDLAFADPPYFLQLNGELLRPNMTAVAGVDDEWDKFDDLEHYDRFTIEWLAQCQRVLRDTGSIWVIGTYHNIHRIGKILMDTGWWLLGDISWIKTNPMPNFRGRRFTNATETLVWACKSAKRTGYTFNYAAMKALNDDLQMRSDWHIPVCGGPERIRVGGKKVHSTQKPEALLHRIITACSNPGDTVLDPFLGTGTTGAVAKRLGRNFIGIDRDPNYTRIARRRIATVQTLDHALLATASKRNAAKVPFGNLIAATLIRPGERLTGPNGAPVAIVKADGHLTANGQCGSIHRIAAKLSGTPAVNGWTFWHVKRDGILVPIDTLRDQYRRTAETSLQVA
jgi:modification methylase